MQVTLETLIEKDIVTGISTLRKNKSGYPYVTMLCGNKSNNVYFGQKTAEVVEGTFNVGEKIEAFLLDCIVMRTENELGETRYKIAKQGSSDYTSGDSLKKTFGLQVAKIIPEDFKLNDFKAEFTAREAVLVAED